MKFLIDFNYPQEGSTYATLIGLGAILVERGEDTDWEIEIDTLEQLEALYKDLNSFKKGYWSLVVDFDAPATIYFDDKV